MSGKFISVCLVIIALLFITCSMGNEHPLNGKWLLSGKIVGHSPSSYWFQKHGTVIAQWEQRKEAMKSLGKYQFIDKTHIKIIMKKGHYKGITFFFEIVKVDKEELILRGSIQDIRMRRVE